MSADQLPSAAQLCAEIAQMSDSHLRAAANTLEWPLHPLRIELDTPTRLAAARQAIADLDRRHDLELWREPGARGRGVSRAQIVKRHLQALARAWARLGGGHELLFHLRGELRPGEDRPLQSAHVDAPRIEINPNFWVRAAPYLEHPISLAEAARFAIVLPVMRCCVPLGEAVASAFDQLGQPTAGLHRRAQQQTEPPVRRAVWRIRSPDRSRRSCVRMVNLAAVHVLRDIGAHLGPEQIGVSVLATHYESWTQLQTVILGMLAWRRACERDIRVGPRKLRVGSELTPNPAVVSRRYGELDDPFTPLLAILWLGVRLHEFSRQAITLAIDPQPAEQTRSA